MIIDAAVFAIITLRFIQKRQKTYFKEAVKNNGAQSNSNRTALALAAGSLITITGLLLVRQVIVRDLGLEAAGLFQAAYGISVLYTGLILNALGADFFPRIVRAKATNADLDALTGHQITTTLSLLAPLSLVVMMLAGPLLSMLYSSDFLPADSLLQWYAVGDSLRALHWILAYRLVVAGQIHLYLLLELFQQTAFFLSCWFFLESTGLDGVGFLQVLCILGVVPLYGFALKIKDSLKVQSSVYPVLAFAAFSVFLARIISLFSTGAGFLVMGTLVILWSVWLYRNFGALYTTSEE